MDLHLNELDHAAAGRECDECHGVVVGVLSDGYEWESGDLLAWCELTVSVIL